MHFAIQICVVLNDAHLLLVISDRGSSLLDHHGSPHPLSGQVEGEASQAVGPVHGAGSDSTCHPRRNKNVSKSQSYLRSLGIVLKNKSLHFIDYYFF